ncbi:LysR substrate-binding domain-containing protein [Falsihalocynthiibacter sp. S25ZX9]|uniref:LysR substrate-binding domain-containing protein n=1 Tax=Falsihalocynthiibacter sp. S25ZX9 TaxID=3240870 RepID=UPI00351069DC
MTRRLPSLNQLRAFEAAARHESIKMGAEELCVTPAAVGHQIKGLELELNTALFRRKTRKIELTEEGRALSEHLGRALDAIEHAVAKARKPDLTGILKITIAPFFGNRWLLPRLPDFHRQHPSIEIIPSLSFDYVDLRNSGFDAAVRYGAGDWDGMSSVLICNDVVSPVCAPQLIDGCQMPLSAGDILALPLACGRRWREDWSAWAKASGSKIANPERVIVYESRAFMFDAALSGQAVILADLKMTAADVAAGSLVRLSPIEVDRPQGLYVVSEATPNVNPRLQVFTNWLELQARG